MNSDYKKFQNLIGYNFKNIDLLVTALTHSSASNSNNYERLEYLGDSLLSIIVADYLYKNTKLSVGEMSVKRSNLVSTEALSKIVLENDWKDYLIVGQSILATHNIAKNILADVFESLTAAIYLDSDFNYAKNFVERYVLVNAKKNQIVDYKTKLQEKLASIDHNKIITYNIVDSTGPSHNMLFTMGLYIDNQLIVNATGSSKKEAEQICAKLVYDKICKDGLGSIKK